MFGIDISEYCLKDLIGQGFNGLSRIYAAVHKPSSANCAVKKYLVDICKEDSFWISVILNNSITSCKFYLVVFFLGRNFDYETVVSSKYNEFTHSICR